MSPAEAEAYELALELCQELTEQHQRLTYQVAKLSELLVHQANLWDKIGQASRPKPEYFRVAYFGDFTPFNKDKDFVVRGHSPSFAIPSSISIPPRRSTDPKLRLQSRCGMARNK